jgi:hypothetical protein
MGSFLVTCEAQQMQNSSVALEEICRVQTMITNKQNKMSQGISLCEEVIE